MKKSIFLLIVLGSSVLSIKAQTVPIDEDTKLVTYKEVVTQEGTPEKLYNQGISWVNSYYKNPADVTKVRDATNSKLVLQHRVKIYNTDKDGVKIDAGVVEYKMTLEFKEGRYRYVITEFNVMKTSRFPMERWLDKNDPQYTPSCDDWVQQVNTEILALIDELKKGMVPKVIKDDNW